ncbi:hypothetical protein DPEC_G00031610 [Dallia pectoralis]|uniref:Uncharacterized protein n=1 Tax=Dallia pectoralis TaxID=75939 RepID=A0ACC2HCM7_DALPE|nr:hypothetical protein DPEC_G00031610 [Dallia pectoralis]
MTLRGPAAQLGPPRDQDRRRSVDRSYWDRLMSKVEVVSRRTTVTGRIAPRPQSAIEARGPCQSPDGWLEELEKMQSQNSYRRGSQISLPGSRPCDQTAKPWPLPPHAHVRPASTVEGGRQLNDWVHGVNRMKGAAYFGGSLCVDPKVERRQTGQTQPPPGTTKRGNQNLDIWLQEHERAEEGGYFGDFPRAQTAYIQAPLRNRTSSMPTLHREPVDPGLIRHDLSSSSSLCGLEGGLSSCDIPSLCSSSPGSRESLCAGSTSATDFRGSWERASIKQTPGKEQAELCCLTPVRVGWLPVRVGPLLRNALVPRETQTCLLENSANQVKLKPPITPSFVKVPVKGQGDRFSDADTVNTVKRRPGTRWPPEQPPDRGTSSTQQVAGKQSPASVQSGTKLLGWQALRRSWAKRTWPSPHTGTRTPSSKDSLPGPGADEEHVGRTNDNQQLLPTRVTARGTSLTSQSPNNSEPFCRKAIPTGMETVNQLKGKHSPVLPGDRDFSTNTEVSKRKVTIIKVTENRHSYIPDQQGRGGRGGNSSRGPSEYSELVMTENSIWQQGTMNSKESLQSPTLCHPELSTDSTGKANCGPTRGSNRSTSTATVCPGEPEDSRGGARRQTHKSTLTLLINPSYHSSKDMFTETKGVTVEGGERGSGGRGGGGGGEEERRARPRRPISCHANMFEHTGPAWSSPGPEAISVEHGWFAAPLPCSVGAVSVTEASAVPRRWSLELPRHTHGTHTDSVPMSKHSPTSSRSETGLLSCGSLVRTEAAGRDYVTGAKRKPEGGASREQGPPLCPEEKGFRSRQPQPPALTLIKPQDPISLQHSPETILALNAAAIIANIKLQRQLSQTKTSSENGLSSSRKSPQGNTLVNDTGGFVTAEADDRWSKPDPGHIKRSPASHLNQNHVVFIPPDSDLDTDIANNLSPREALERSRPDFIRRSQGRVRDMERRAEERRVEERRMCPTSEHHSDNLFRPRDRAITGKKICLGTRQKQKKQAEEARRREVQQINRLRANLFKKKILDQILQRGSD